MAIDPTPHCCENCFADSFLRERVVAESVESGDCDYCGSTDGPILEPARLRDMFGHIFDYYEVVQADVHYLSSAEPLSLGTSLDQLLDDDGWQIFSSTILGRGSTELLQEILGPERQVADRWTDIKQRWYVEPGEDPWSQFANDLRDHRRFFVGLEEGFLTRCAELLTGIESELEQGKSLYRTRRGGKHRDWHGKPLEPYTSEEMGAPPPRADRFGRANPPGISYLYAALDAKTAVAEMRPARGALLSLARLTTTQVMRVVDLAKVTPLNSLFEITEYYGVPTLRIPIEDRELLLRFAYELARPVWQTDASVDYLPTQYLAEFILSLGYDGIIYNSGFSNGKNIVLFPVNAAEVEEVNLAEVTKVNIEVGTPF